MGYDLVNELLYKTKELNKLVDDANNYGQLLAKAERTYRIGLATKLIELKAAGVAATLCSDLARGDEVIAQLREERDKAEVWYRSSLEHIMASKLEVKILEGQIEREWTKNE